MYRLNYCQPGALPPFRAFALTAREGLVALPRVSLPSVAGPGLQALPPAEVEGWPSAILNAAYGAYTMETICGTTHCDCLPDSNIVEYRADDAETFRFRLMRRPSGARTHLGVGGIPEQRSGIALPPWAEQDTLRFHDS